MKTACQAMARFYGSATDRFLQHERRSLVILLLLALALRLAYIGLFVGFNSPPEYDGIGYDQVARSVLAGQGYVNAWGEPTAHKPPVYALFLAATYVVANHSLAAVRALQAAFDAITALFVYGIAKRTIGPRPAVLSALGVAVYPLLVYETGLIIPETLSHMLQFGATLCLVIMLTRNHLVLAWVAGILMGLTVLARPTATLWVPLILVWMMILPRFLDGRFARLAVVLVGLAIVFVPWILRNLVTFRSFVPVSTTGSSNIWSGNNAWAEGGSVLPTAATWEGPDYPTRGWYGWEGVSEPESNRRFVQAGMNWIEKHPREFVALVPKKLLRLWSPVSYSVQSGREASKLTATLVIPPYVLFLGIAGYGIFLSRRQWREIFPLLAIIISINSVVVIYYGATRYGIPMMLVLIIFAALAADRLLAGRPKSKVPTS